MRLYAHVAIDFQFDHFIVFSCFDYQNGELLMRNWVGIVNQKLMIWSKNHIKWKYCTAIPLGKNANPKSPLFNHWTSHKVYFLSFDCLILAHFGNLRSLKNLNCVVNVVNCLFIDLKSENDHSFSSCSVLVHDHMYDLCEKDSHLLDSIRMSRIKQSNGILGYL
jgi:hypothetical protein